MSEEKQDARTVTLSADDLSKILEKRDQALIASMREHRESGFAVQALKQVTGLVKAAHGQVHLGRLMVYGVFVWEITHFDKLAQDGNPDSLIEVMQAFFSFLGG